tara:strand:- start:8029 stop:8652 length:624 start_codon:yes stop_codon:yes gene_type:complete
MFSHSVAAALAVGVGLTTSLLVQSSPEILSAAFTLDGVEKSFRQTATLDAAQVSAFHKPDPNCGPLCIAPLAASSAVSTVGEREVIRFVADQVASGEGLLIDSRQPEDRAAGFITASVNVPFNLLQSDNPYVADILQALGARAFEGTLNFSDAMPLVVFDDGPTTNDAPTFIANLIATGYPAEKLSYYRGGMLVWTALGLNTQDAKS